MTKEQKQYAVVYCRVSTDEQAKEGLSIETQEKICSELLLKDGYVQLPTLKDEGRSGKDMNRPAMRELMKLVNERQIRAVYVVHNDRIGRNTKDYLVFKDLLKKQEVTLKCVYQPMLGGDSATARTMDTLMMSFNEMQRLITAEKVKSVMTEIAKAGYFPTCPPAGYFNTTNPDKTIGRIGRNIIAPDPVMGPLITELFHLYARGDMNVYEVADVMYEKGLRNQQGQRVQPNRLYPLLHNRIYLGEVHWGGVVVKNGKHKPLIDEGTFNAVQAILEEKNRRACRRRKYEWLLAGLIVCPRHQRRYTAEWHLNKKLAYYHCSHRNGCGKYIEMTKLEGMVADKFRDLEFSDEFVELVVEKARKIFHERRKKYDARRQGIINRRTALELRRKRVENKLFDGTLTDEDFTRIRKEVQTDLAQIEDTLAQLEGERELNVDIAQEVLLLTRDIYKAYTKASKKLKRQYLTLFWDHFEVLDGVILTSTPAPFFAALLELEAAIYKQPTVTIPQEIAQNSGFILSSTLSARRGSNPRPSP